MSLAGTKAGMTVNQLLAINDAEGVNGYTGGQLYQVIIGNNNPINLPTRFKLNYVIGADNGDAWDMAVYQIEVYSGSTDTLHLIAGKEVFGGAKKIINLHTTDAESDLPMIDFVFSLNASGLYEASSTFVGLFISSTTSGKLDVSSANMYVEAGARNDRVAEFLPGGTVWQDILAEMGYVPNSVLA